MTNATVTSLARYRIRRATRVANTTHLVAGLPAGFKQTPVTLGLSSPSPVRSLGVSPASSDPREIPDWVA